MKIGFDAKRLFHNHTGLGSYSRTLVSSLVKRNPDHQFFLYTPPGGIEEVYDTFKHFSNVHIRIGKSKLSPYWRTRTIIKDLVADDIDIYHGLSAELPIGIHKTKIKSIVTIHDVLHKIYPTDYGLIDRLVMDSKLKYAISKADKLICISKYTLDSLKAFYNFENSKAEVIYQDINPKFYQELSELALLIFSKMDINDNYILCVGNSKLRKNISLAIELIDFLPEHIHLIIINAGKQEVTKKPNPRITELRTVDLELLKVIYSNALCLLYPSLAEGWGLPIEESIALNTPVVLPDIAPFNEIASPLKVIYAKNSKLEEISKKIKSIEKMDYKSLISKEMEATNTQRIFKNYLKLVK